LFPRWIISEKGDDVMTNANKTDISWKSLYTVGGMAALIAGVLFRRNLAVEIRMLSKVSRGLLPLNDNPSPNFDSP